jgi:hypothetical protein
MIKASGCFRLSRAAGGVLVDLVDVFRGCTAEGWAGLAALVSMMVVSILA